MIELLKTVMGGQSGGGVEPGLPWNPLYLVSEPPIYLDAELSIVTDAGGYASAISNLGALGTAGDFSQATASRRPQIVSGALNGNRILRFDGTDDVLTAGASAALGVFRNVQAAWVFAVYKKRGQDVSPTARYLFYSPRNDSAVRFGLLSGSSGSGRANQPYIFARRLDAESAAELPSGIAVNGTYAMFAAAVDFSTRAGVLRNNGQQIAANATLTASAGSTSDTQASSTYQLAVGAYYSGALPSDVDLAAIVLGNTQMTVTEMQKLEGWAAHRFGLTANLPASHPYKTEAPTT